MSRSTRLLMAGARSAGRLITSRLRPGGRAAAWAAVGESWFETLGEMKGAAMKLGQLASQYADLLPPELAEPLSRLQREAPPRPFAGIEAVLAAEWQPAQRAEIASIDPKALAAASIGQVHRARHRDGRELVVKVRYPGVAEAVDADVATLGRLMRLGRLIRIEPEALDALLAEVRARLKEETDYRRECAHLQALREALALPGLRYPEPLPALCTSAVLVTAYTPAPSLAEARDHPQAVRDALGERLLAWSLAQALQTGWVHADPHAGNFGFGADGVLTVYDFGCVKRLPQGMPARLRRLLRLAMAEDLEGLDAGLQALGSVRPGLPLAAPERLALYRALHAALLGRVCREAYFDFADGRLIDEARAVARRELRLLLKDFQPVPELAFPARALSGHYWLLRGLRARVPVRALLEPYLAGG